MEYQEISFERRGHIGIVTLNRPDRMNALSPAMQTEITHCFSALTDDLHTRVVILRAEGRAFCAGADVRALAAGVPAEDDLGDVQATYHRRVQPGMFGPCMAIRRAPQPIIAASKGAAVGGGFALVLACDARIAGESVRFRASFVRIGVSGGDMGTTFHLPRLVGFARASDYLFTGRFVEAAEALQVGLVSRLVPDDQLDEAAIAFAEQMLEISPFGLRLTKELLNYSAGAATLESVLHMESRSQALCMLTEDAKEGPRAFLEKRPAVWQDR